MTKGTEWLFIVIISAFSWWYEFLPILFGNQPFMKEQRNECHCITSHKESLSKKLWSSDANLALHGFLVLGRCCCLITILRIRRSYSSWKGFNGRERINDVCMTLFGQIRISGINCVDLYNIASFMYDGISQTTIPNKIPFSLLMGSFLRCDIGWLRIAFGIFLLSCVRGDFRTVVSCFVGHDWLFKAESCCVVRSSFGQTMG